MNGNEGHGAEPREESEATPNGETAETIEGAAAAPPRPPSFARAVLERLAWRPAPEDGAGAGDAVIVANGGLALALWLAADRYSAGADALWYPGGATSVAWYALGVLALAFVMSRAASPRAPFRSLLASLVGALPLTLALGLAVEEWAPPPLRPLAFGLLGLALVAHARRALAGAGGGRPLRALAAGGLLALAFGWSTSALFVHPHFWFAGGDEDEEEEEEETWPEAERRLFEQADRIDAAAARLAGGRPDRPDVYFLGFAGVGEEKVFAEELGFAARVVESRYGTSGRSLLLVNDRRDRETHPFATVHGLKRALRRLGERMDRDEDVLFLLLTSHGSQDLRLSVSNGNWPLAGLDAPTLRSALDASGIRWRVVVVSACYSGGFVEPLADDHTIVLTSAARDRVSFGCSDEREITDFGAAFLRDALPQADSLAGAFEKARVAIAEQERKAGLQASLPQAHFGGKMAERWKRIEAEHRR